MTKIKNLQDLLIDESKNLYNSIEQEMFELPLIEKSANSSDLKKLIGKQIISNELQQRYLKEAVSKLNGDCEGGVCEATQIILKQSNDRIAKSTDTKVRDASIINSLQYLSHRKIAGFGSGAAYANQIGRKDAAKLFHKALEAEKKIDNSLSQLAEREINKKALAVMLD